MTDIPLESELLKNKYIYLSNNKKSIHEWDRKKYDDNLITI
jgi:hypothetical protein